MVCSTYAMGTKFISDMLFYATTLRFSYDLQTIISICLADLQHLSRVHHVLRIDCGFDRLHQIAFDVRLIAS